MTISRKDFLDFLTATCAAAAIPDALTSDAIGIHSNMAATRRAVNNSEAIANGVDLNPRLDSVRVSQT